MLLHPPQHAGESLCVVFEACIHASEGAQAPMIIEVDCILIRKKMIRMGF
jgi:hypothetical protein